MENHAAPKPGRVAVITAAASGTGLATALRIAAMMLNVCLADLSERALERAAEQVAAHSGLLVGLAAIFQIAHPEALPAKQCDHTTA
jgi:NAD(P)-dependent dehydrogenase (short-subunit alcohol dehydrogenase family)